MRMAINNITSLYLKTKNYYISILDIFRRKKTHTINSANTDVQVVATQNLQSGLSETLPVDYNLFVDEQPPYLKEAPKQPSNSIEKFMNQSFQPEGYKNGYDFPETEYLES